MANDGFSWSRFGPIVPVAAAAASVWQLAQFAEKIDFPSVPCCAGGFAFVPAAAATKPATSTASLPVTRLLGIGGDARRIWSRTTFSIVLSLKPSLLGPAKAK